MFGRPNRLAPPPPVLSPTAQAILARLTGRQAVGGALGPEATQQKGIGYFKYLAEHPTPEFRQLPERYENLIAIIKLLRNKREGAVLGSDKSLCEHLGQTEDNLIRTLIAIAKGCGSELGQIINNLFELLYQIPIDPDTKQPLYTYENGSPGYPYPSEIIFRLLGGTDADAPQIVDAKIRQFLGLTNGLQWLQHMAALNLNDALVAISTEVRQPSQPQRTLQEIAAAHGIPLQPLTIHWGAPVMPAPPAGVPVPVAVPPAPGPAPAPVPPAPAPAAVPAPAVAAPAVAPVPAPATPTPAPVAPGGIDRADVLRDPALKEARDFLSRLLSYFIKTDVGTLGDLDIKINDALSSYFSHEYPLGTALFVAKGRAIKTGSAPSLLEILETTFKPGDTAGIKQIILHVHAALKDLAELAAIAKPAIPAAAPAAVPPPIPAAAFAVPAASAAVPIQAPARPVAVPNPIAVPAPVPAPAPAAPDPRVEKEQALKAAVNWFNKTLIPALFQSQDLSLAEEINQRFLGYLATFQQTGPRIGNRIYSEALDGETDIQRIIPKVINTKNPEALIIVLYNLIKNLDLTPHATAAPSAPLPAPARAVPTPVAAPRPAAVPVPVGARPAVPVAVAAQPLTREAAAARYQAGFNQFCDQAARLLSSPLNLNTPTDTSALEISIRDMERLYTDAVFARIQPDERIGQLHLALIRHRGRSIFANPKRVLSDTEKRNLSQWYFERLAEGITNPAVALAVVTELNWFCQNYYPNLWNDFLEFLRRHPRDVALYQKLARNGVAADLENRFRWPVGSVARVMGVQTA